MDNSLINMSNKSVAYNGAIVTVAAVFGYSLVIMMYVLMRSSFTIYNIMPSGERSNILLINGFSIAYSVAIFSVLMALLSSVFGAVASVILKKSLVYFNPQFNYKKAVTVSATVALAILIIIYTFLYALLKGWMTLNYIETFSFWFLFPAVIFFIACIIGGRQLNRILLNNLKL